MSITTFYRESTGPYSTLLRERDAGNPVSPEKLRQAAKGVIAGGITKPFIYSISSKDTHKTLGHLIGAHHYCNMEMIRNAEIEKVVTSCSALFMERLPAWYSRKPSLDALTAGIAAVVKPTALNAKFGLNVIMDSTLCMRAASKHTECHAMDLDEEYSIRCKFLEQKPLFSLDVQGNEYRMRSAESLDGALKLPKGSLDVLCNRSDEERALEILEFYQYGAAGQIYNSMLIAGGDIYEVIFKPNVVWAERSIIPALQALKQDEAPIAVLVGANHLFGSPSAADQTGLIKILREKGFEVTRV